jgi:hydroxyacylglutathione hydrolase
MVTLTNSETFLIKDPTISLLTYYIESNKEAVVIDPMRDYQPYLNFLKERGAKLKYVLLTHIPSDYVSGCLDLSLQTGAKILVGAGSRLKYECEILNDGDEIRFGSAIVKAIYTPGHTIESMTYLLMNESRKHHAVFTGDTVLCGSVCAPDLTFIQKHTERDLGLLLYNSINRLKELDGDVLVYPGHTVGSICVKRASDSITSTIANEIQNNVFFNFEDKEEFLNTLVKFKLDIKNRSYLANIAKINIEGYEPLSETLSRISKPISPEIADRMAKKTCMILDTRERESLNKGVIKNSLTIPLKEQFCICSGTLIKKTDKLILLTDDKKEEEALKMLIKIGIYNIEGYVSGGVEKWVKFALPLVKMEKITKDLVPKYLYNREISLLDVREDSEYEVGKLPNSQSLPLSKLNSPLIGELLPKDEKLYIFCTKGGMSVMAYSLLRRNGFDNVIVLEDGLLNIEHKNIPLMV